MSFWSASQNARSLSKVLVPCALITGVCYSQILKILPKKYTYMNMYMYYSQCVTHYYCLLGGKGWYHRNCEFSHRY